MHDNTLEVYVVIENQNTNDNYICIFRVFLGNDITVSGS